MRPSSRARVAEVTPSSMAARTASAERCRLWATSSPGREQLSARIESSAARRSSPGAPARRRRLVLGDGQRIERRPSLPGSWKTPAHRHPWSQMSRSRNDQYRGRPNSTTRIDVREQRGALACREHRGHGAARAQAVATAARAGCRAEDERFTSAPGPALQSSVSSSARTLLPSSAGRGSPKKGRRGGAPGGAGDLHHHGLGALARQQAEPASRTLRNR